MAKRRTLLMRLLSWAADHFTPNTFYYSDTLKAEVSKSLQELDVRRSGDGNALGPACLSMSIAAAKHMPNVGDTLTSTIHGATNRGREIGSFRIHVERISDEEAANG